MLNPRSLYEKKMVLYQRKESIALITLNKVNSKNAVNSQIIAELENIRNEISKVDDIRVVIFTEIDTFCAGNDRKAFSSFESKDELIQYLSLCPVVDAINRPTIAAIGGDAIGQRLELALVCDLRICSESAHFAMDNITYGDIPWDGGTQRLARLVGKAKAIEMILTGEPIDAQEAYRNNLVNKVVPSQELMTVAMDMAQGMASRGPIALRYAKEAIHKGMDLNLEQGLRLESDLYYLIHTTRDRTEGIRAFQEKRKVQFKGL